MFLLGGGNEEDVANSWFAAGGQTLQNEFPATDSPTRDQFLHLFAHFGIARHRDNNGAVRLGKFLRRPVGILRKIDEKRRLDLIFGERLLFRGRNRYSKEPTRSHQKQRATQNPPCISSTSATRSGQVVRNLG